MSKYRTFRPRRGGPHNEYQPDEADLELEEEHIADEDKPKWRKRHRSLQTKPICTEHFPDLLRAMYADGLRCTLTDEGYQWFAGNYRVSNISVREVWGLSETQWKRLMRYVFIHGVVWDE